MSLFMSEDLESQKRMSTATEQGTAKKAKANGSSSPGGDGRRAEAVIDESKCPLDMTPDELVETQMAVKAFVDDGYAWCSYLFDSPEEKHYMEKIYCSLCRSKDHFGMHCPTVKMLCSSCYATNEHYADGCPRLKAQATSAPSPSSTST